MLANRCLRPSEVEAMSVSKDPERGTFYVQRRYRDWTGGSKKKTKRGFKTEKEVNLNQIR